MERIRERSIGGRRVRVETTPADLRRRLREGGVWQIARAILAGGEGEPSRAVVTSVPEELQLPSSLRRALRQAGAGKDSRVESVSVHGRKTAGFCRGNELASSVNLALKDNNNGPAVFAYHPSCRHFMVMVGGRNNYFPLRAREIYSLNGFLIRLFFGADDGT